MWQNETLILSQPLTADPEDWGWVQAYIQFVGYRLYGENWISTN